MSRRLVNQDMKATSDDSLSAVVSKLVRASMGTSVATTVPDDELDRHVAELILREAKQKEKLYFGKEGIQAYLPHTGLPENNVPRTNKRFLTSIIKSTDEHNKAVLRTQAIAAAEAKQQREEQERRERMARAREAADERMRRLMGESDRRSRSGARERRNGKRREASWERWGSSRGHSESKTRRSKHGRSRSRERSPERSTRRRLTRSRSPQEDSRRSRRHRSRSPESVRKRHHKERSHRSRRRHSRTSTPMEDTPPHSSQALPDHRSPSPSTPISRIASHNRSEAPSNRTELTVSAPSGSASSSRTSTPGPIPLSSKMDKYFDESYDPRLDISPNLTSDGFIPSGSFEGWDAMLQLIKAKREYKAEQKRLEKLEGKSSKGKKSSQYRLEPPTNSQTLMDVVYPKTGEVREWDASK